MVKYERKILQISKIKEIDMKTLIVTGGSLDISWAKDFVRTINAEYIIAADSGLKYIDELGLVPDMILGDYDSVEDGLLDKYKSIDIKTYPKEKDYTDTHIAIINALKAGASVIYILGATGTRMDHTFTNICNMKAALDSGVPCFICDSHNKIYLINDKMGEVKVSKTGQYGDYVSFVPLSEETIISLAGFKYVLDDYILNQGLSIGTLGSYWEANMELVDLIPEFNLYEEYWKIYTAAAPTPTSRATASAASPVRPSS